MRNVRGGETALSADATESKGSEGTVGVWRFVMRLAHSAALTNAGRSPHCRRRSGESVWVSSGSVRKS